jgi:hypothetical protein
MAIRVAATLNLVELATPTGATPEHLAAKTNTTPQAIQRLLNHLVTINVFEHEEGTYRPTPLGAQMSEHAPEGVKPLLDINSAGGRADLAFVDLLHTITTDTPAYPHRYGSDFWTDLDTHPHLRRSFDAQMKWRFQIQAPQIAERFDWSRFTTILDVGGGDGTVLTAILQAHPTVQGEILDLTADPTAPHDRATRRTGSFFDPLPKADAYLVSDILHDWDDDHAGKILARCAQAAAENGTVVVIEPIRGQGADTAIDLFMMICFGGRERTVDELTALAEDNGLALHSTTPVAQGRTALEFTPA